jgi:hypothetical protein
MMANALALASHGWLSIVWLVAWQSTAMLTLGLATTRIVAMRPSRAHRILLVSALACLVVPAATLVANRFDFGLFSPQQDSKPEKLIEAAESKSAPVAVGVQPALGLPTAADTAGAMRAADQLRRDTLTPEDQNQSTNPANQRAESPRESAIAPSMIVMMRSGRSCR